LNGKKDDELMPRVVTCIIEYQGNILLLKRSQKVGTYKGLWGGVAGFVEEGEEPYDTALKELHEEVGLSQENVRLGKKETPIKFTDVYEGRTYEWTIYPFLFHLIKKKDIRLDWEHTEFAWVAPKDLSRYPTVPHLEKVVQVLL